MLSGVSAGLISCFLISSLGADSDFLSSFGVSFVGSDFSSGFLSDSFFGSAGLLAVFTSGLLSFFLTSSFGFSSGFLSGSFFGSAGLSVGFTSGLLSSFGLLIFLSIILLWYSLSPRSVLANSNTSLSLIFWHFFAYSSFPLIHLIKESSVSPYISFIFCKCSSSENSEMLCLVISLILSVPVSFFSDSGAVISLSKSIISVRNKRYLCDNFFRC